MFYQFMGVNLEGTLTEADCDVIKRFVGEALQCERKYQSLYSDFAAAAFAWEEERAELWTRTDELLGRAFNAEADRDNQAWHREQERLLAAELDTRLHQERARAEKAEAELVEWKARHEGIRLANEVMRGQLERANARLDKAEPPKPRAFRDAENDVWVEVAPGRLSGCWDYDAGVMDLSIIYANVERSEVEATWGPLREITER